MAGFFTKLGLVSRNEQEPSGRPKKPTKKNALINALPEEAIINKLKKTNRQAQNMPADELREWARSLCIKEELIEWYLNPEFANTLEALNKLDEAQAKIINGNDTSSGLFVSSKSESVPVRNEQNEDDMFNDIDYDIEDIERAAKQPNMKVGKSIKIKLVIAEICKSDTQKALRKLLSPVLTKFDAQQQFGMFHSALVVGPWYLEWNNSSMCIPRKCYSSAAMLAADLEFSGKLGKVGFDLDQTIEKITPIIIDWNVNKTYSQREANCQQFVDEICNVLDIPIKFEGPLGEYLNAIRERGECDLEFPISTEMREQLEIRDKKRRFETHQELDEFVCMLIDKDPQFENNFPAEWMLLKSFDRAFWLRHFKVKTDDKFTPGCDAGECPFKDPEVTASFKPEWF
ncbi:hypothetical protein AKO1_004217 [Acrasis kona]|uniref:Uncharacterized protein n=1 Tax=Acrasis kona TaxID=1008807 RepID=A0AAW2YGN2_9EUKA